MTKTYRTRKYLPLFIARKYLKNDFRAIKKIKQFFVEYDDFPAMIKGKENVNDEIKIECFANVPDSFVPELLSNLSTEENESFLAEMIYEDYDKSGVYPEDISHGLPESFIFTGEITESIVYVTKKEVLNIAKRWNLFRDSSALDLEVIDEQEEATETTEGTKAEINLQHANIENSSTRIVTEAVTSTTNCDQSRATQNIYKNQETDEEDDEEEGEDGRKSRHLKTQLELLGGAFLGAILYRDEFYDSEGKLTAIQIVKTLEDHSALLWPDRKDHPKGKIMPIASAAQRHVSALIKRIPIEKLQKRKNQR